MIKINDIKELSTKLANKNNYVRRATEELMIKWQNISDCKEIIHADHIAVTKQRKYDGQDMIFYLFAGEKDLMAWDSLKLKYVTYNQYINSIFAVNFWDDLNMSDLRDFLNNFTCMVDEITRKMQQKLIEIQKIEQFLNNKID